MKSDDYYRGWNDANHRRIERAAIGRAFESYSSASIFAWTIGVFGASFLASFLVQLVRFGHFNQWFIIIATIALTLSGFGFRDKRRLLADGIALQDAFNAKEAARVS